ncbi:MAG TPA: UDP-N-acetylmuramoyl-L-alanyl-D-glutamate--2,6-diaminopimelate ligase [Aquifex aeolicus]|uniref:UDP-N-acetylmuramoyl-L-alanyl-D-glutamate--2,6-diaminopimelate ligase n=1 Tax=Aquifex aeolicus TaxID=63363 RepID=A0A9D0YQW8_AQUAO|nr:UDP-N-acetylmuramoyl-L-alanyl-D-glutamate--2,6-diaminopimelate ligase [Aquifex aeolicus]
MKKLFQLVKLARDITDNSSEVCQGSIFFAIRGTKFDGHSFVGEVLKKKPLAVVVEKGYTPPPEVNKLGVKLLKVKDTRRAFAQACREFFNKPDEKLKIFGITGTNGKTSSAFLLAGLLNGLNIPTGVIGTVAYRFGQKFYGKGQTTPHPKVWYKTLSKMVEEGAKAVACEISSHALWQRRIYGTCFEGVIFTNISQDHLDYHLTMENYFLAKRLLFSEYMYKAGVVNGDDLYGRRLIEEFSLQSFGTKPENDYRILRRRVTLKGLGFELSTPKGKVYSFSSNLRGEFQVFNLAGVVSLLLALGFPSKDIQRVCKNLPQIPGRFEIVAEKPFTVIVDYAHTPDAMEKLLKAVVNLKPRRVITVFGAGGNRDKVKRPLMGAIAERFSDLVILTSDNPRYEEPLEIIGDILRGIRDRFKVEVKPDRREAIEQALKMAKEGDVVVIAGKGHEDYQEIKGVKYPFDDRKVVLEILDNLQKG